LWASAHLGDPAKWTSILVDQLEPRGRLTIIEKANRQMLPEQQLTSEIVQLSLEVEAALGIALIPLCDPDRLFEYFRSGELNHIRSRVFTDPELLLGADFWDKEANCLFTRLMEDADRLNPVLRDNFVHRAEALKSCLARHELGTPPFVMLTGTKRSSAWVYRTEKADKATIDEPQQSVNIGESLCSLNDPYDRMLHTGPEALKNFELMTIALSSVQSDDNGSSNDAHQFARRIISEYGTKAVAEERNPGRLAEMLCIPLEVACRIVAIFALGRRFFEEPISHYPVIRGPEDAYVYLSEMGSLRKEHLRGLYLNVQSRLVHDEVISIGTISRSLVHPREVYAPALEYSANSIILAHNHPSGDLTPSENDIAITKQIAQAGRIMGIDLVDHLIIGAGGFVSLKKKKVL